MVTKQVTTSRGEKTKQSVQDEHRMMWLKARKERGRSTEMSIRSLQ